MCQRFVISVGLAVAVAALWPLAADAGILQLGQANIQGTSVTIPVVLQGDVGSGVSAMDFTITYDPNLLEPVKVESGAAASAADKDVQFNLIEPGRCKVVMMGLNQNVVEEGEVANVIMRRTSTGAGNAEVAVVDPTFADLNATAIPSQGSTETVDFSGDGQTTGGNTDGQQGSGNSGDGRTRPGQESNSATQPGEAAAGPGTGTTVPTPGVPAATGVSSLAGGALANLPKGIPMDGTKLGPGTPAKPGAGTMAKALGTAGKVPQLPQGVRPRNAGADAASGHAGMLSDQPDTAEGPSDTPSAPVAKVAMNTPDAVLSGLPPGAAPKLAAPATGPTSKASGSAAPISGGFSVKWIGVGVIVLALLCLFALRRRLFT